MYEMLRELNERPEPFEFYTAADLWNDEHISRKMLVFHLNEGVDPASRKMSFIKQSAQWMVERFGIGEGFRVADFGCGPGLYATRLAAAGAGVVGIDFSKRSILHAREAAMQSGLDIEYVEANYLDYTPAGHLDLVCLIYCDLCALSPEQRRQLLTRFREALAPGGRILLDVFSLKAYEDRGESAHYEHRLHDGFWAADDYYGFLNCFKYDAEKLIVDKYTIVEAERTRRIYNWLQYFSVESIMAEFEAAGLEIEDVYADVAGKPHYKQAPEIAIVAGRD